MFFCKMKIVTSHGGGGGGPSQCHQMTHGGGGGVPPPPPPPPPKIGQKSVKYYLNGPNQYLKRMTQQRMLHIIIQQYFGHRQFWQI